MPRATHCPVQKGAMGTKWQMLVKQVGEDAAWKNWTAYNGFPATFKPSADLKKELGWGQDMSLDSRNRLISRVNQYNQRNNTSHQVVNVKHPNNPGRWNPELNINYLPYSNDKLQELIRKTYKDNTLVYSSDEFTKLQYSPVKPKAPSLFENPAFQKNDKVKTGVSELFQQNPELSKIGSQEQYSQYLDTIFPDSKVKDIVYHKTKQSFDKFDKEKVITGGFYFTRTSDRYDHIGEKEEGKLKTLQVLLNLKSPITEDTDFASEAINGWEHIEPLQKQGFDSIIDDTGHEEIIVFEPEQIHILGSKQDIEGFKKFTKNSPAIQKEQSKIQPVINISKGLTAKMGVWHAFITPEQAVELSNGQWNGEAGFYHNGNVYLVDGFIDEDTQVHEFAHPLVRSLMLNNPDVADSLWFQFLEHEEGINILNDVERLYSENFDKDGNPNAAAIEEMLVRAITHEAMKGKKYTGFSKVVRDILKAILDAFHSIFGKDVVDITELKTNTTIKDLAKLMTDDSKIELHRDWYADKNDPSFVRAIEHAVNVANMVGLDFTNVAQEQVQREADQRYEDRVNHLETYFGKRLLNLRYNEVARAFDITPARNKDTAHLNFWQFEYFQHGFNKKRKDDIEMAENSNTLLSKQVYTSLRYTGFTYGEMVDPLKHNFYNEYLIDAEYEKYKKAHALSQKIMTKWPTQQALQNADPAEIKRDIIRLERLGTINGGHVLTKLKQVQMTQFILERVKKENQPGITTRERRNRGTAGTNFFNEVLDAVVFGEKIDDIHSISGLFQSYVFFSADGIQLAQQLIEEKKKEARDHFHYAERELKDKFKAIRTSGADINEIIIKLPDASGEMREYFISSKLPHTGYQNDKLIELQKREKAGDAKAKALIDFLKTHYKFMETYGGFDRGDIQTYALPQTGADPIDIFKKYFKVSDPLQGLKHVFYSEAEQEYFLDDIVIKTDRGNMQYAAAKRLVLSDMRKGLFNAAAGALKIKTYRHAASLILDDAKASKDNFAFDVGNNIVVAPKSEPPAGAPFTPNKYRSENIEAILTNYYMGLFYQNALQSNLPSIEYIRDYYGQQHKKNLEKLLDNIIRFRVYKDRRTQKVGAKTGMAIEFMTTWSIWRSLGLNYMSMIPNAAAAHGNYFKEYGINGYTSLAHKFFNQVMFGNGKNPFKNITKVYNILHNLEIINTRGHVSLSTSTESLGRLQRILFITTEVVETINQMPFMWYNLDNKYFNDYDDDGILIPGKEGIPAALKLEIERTVMRNNGAYSDASKGAYSYNLEWRTAASLRNWMIAGMTETFGMQKKVADTEYAGFITADVQLAYQTLKKIKEGKFKDVGDIPAYQRLALTKTLRISMLGVIALYGMTMFDTDDDEDKEILGWIKKAFQSVTTFLNWGDTNFKRGLNTISPTIGVLTDLITFVFTSYQQYKGASVYGKGESKKDADDGDYKLKRNVVQLLPASTIWKGILKEQVKSEKEKDDGPLMLQPIEPIEPVTMKPISNEDE